MKRVILDNSIFVLAHKVASTAAQAFGPQMEKEGITLWTWRVLATLLENEDRRLSDIAEALSVEISTLSRLVASMEKRQLVTRGYRTGKDGRALSINLTDRGREFGEEILLQFNDLNNYYLRNVTPAEQDVVKRCLLQIYSDISSSPPIDLNLDGVRQHSLKNGQAGPCDDAEADGVHRK